MKYSKLIVVSSAIAMLGFSACGGGGGSTSPTTSVDTKTGVFLDSAVEGLSYSCVASGLSGKTNANGEYKYKDGDICTFSIGSMEIGSARAKGIMTPLDIIDLYNGEEGKFYNVLRVLQTLDQDGNASNGIVLPNVDGNITGGFNVGYSSFDSAFQDFLDTNGINASIVSQQDASGHFEQTLLNKFDANLTDAMFEDKMITLGNRQLILKTDKSMEVFLIGADEPCYGSWSLSDEHTLLVSATSCGLFRQTTLMDPQEHKFMFADTPDQGVDVLDIYLDNSVSLHEVDSFTDAVAPTAPTNITYSDINESSFTINWNNNSDNETINRVVCYENADEQTRPMLQFLPGSSATEFSVTYSELDIDTLYGCKVYAANLIGASDSAIVNVTTTAVSANDTNSSSDANNTLASIDVRDLNGYTIITEIPNGVIKERAYIFGAGDNVTMVFNRKDGGQYVKSGTYVLTDVSQQLTVELQFDDTTFLYYVLPYDENHLIYPQAYITNGITATRITTNAESGIVIQNDQPLATSDALSVTSIDDLKGYTITSNVSDDQDSTSIVINCDGSSDTTYSVVISGQTYTDTAHFNEIEMRPEALIYTNVDVGEYWLLLSSTNQLIENKTCISPLNDDGTCMNNWKIQTIEHTTQCQ